MGLTPDEMEALFREFCVACRNPSTPAAKAFLRSQADRGMWDRLSERCLARVSPSYQEIVTSFSDGMAS